MKSKWLDEPFLYEGGFSPFYWTRRSLLKHGCIMAAKGIFDSSLENPNIMDKQYIGAFWALYEELI